MMLHFQRLNVPGSFCEYTWCSISRDRMHLVLSECKHDVPFPEIEWNLFSLSTNMMFPFQRSNGTCSLWAQTCCSLSRDWMNLFPLSTNMFHFRDPMHLVLSECIHDVPLPEIECTCVRNMGSCTKKPGCSLYGTCFSVCSWRFQGLKYWKPPFTPKQSVFKQSFSTLTENLPLHPNYLFLSLLKTCL